MMLIWWLFFTKFYFHWNFLYLIPNMSSSLFFKDEIDVYLLNFLQSSLPLPQNYIASFFSVQVLVLLGVKLSIQVLFHFHHLHQQLHGFSRIETNFSISVVYTVSFVQIYNFKLVSFLLTGKIRISIHIYIY